MAKPEELILDLGLDKLRAKTKSPEASTIKLVQSPG